MQISFIGGGNMAAAIIAGLKKNNFAMQDILVIEIDTSKCQQLETDYAVRTSQAIADISASEVIILAVKPQQLKALATLIAPYLTEQSVVSIAAGVRLNDLSRWLNGYATIIRCMPNTPAQIQAGVSALVAMPSVSAAQIQQTDAILSTVGKTLWLADEAKLDAVTAISGSGPAYVFYLIEALQAAGIELGLSADESSLLSLHTFAGASQLAITSQVDVATLRTQVTSKGGTTEQGLLSLEHANVKQAMINAALAAAKKSSQLGDSLGSD